MQVYKFIHYFEIKTGMYLYLQKNFSSKFVKLFILVEIVMAYNLEKLINDVNTIYKFSHAQSLKAMKL